MEEWKEYKLGDICEFQNGYAFKSSDFSTEIIIALVTLFTQERINRSQQFRFWDNTAHTPEQLTVSEQR